MSVSQSWIPLQVSDRKQGAFWLTNKRVQIKIQSILKLVSFESLAGNDFSQRGTKAEASCERNLQLWNRETVKSWTDKYLTKKYRIKEFWVALLLASAASLKVTDLLFVKEQHN